MAAPLVTALTERTGATTKQYLYGQGDSPLAVYSGTTWTYLSGRDGLNSVRQETDAAGNVLTARRFDPYGVPLSGNGGAPFGYTGEAYDASTQLVFLRARYMQPALGMFLSLDPTGNNLASTGNGFGYVDSDPINQVDPAGLCPLPLGCRPFHSVYVQDVQDVRSMGGLALRSYISIGEKSVIKRLPVGTMVIPLLFGPFVDSGRLWQYVAVPGEGAGFMPEWNLEAHAEYLSETPPQPTPPPTGGGADNQWWPFGDGIGYLKGWRFPGSHKGIDLVSLNDPFARSGQVECNQTGCRYIGIACPSYSNYQDDDGRKVVAVAEGEIGDVQGTGTDVNSSYMELTYTAGGKTYWVQYVHVNPKRGSGHVFKGEVLGWYGPYGDFGPVMHLHLYLKEGGQKGTLVDPEPHLQYPQ